MGKSVGSKYGGRHAIIRKLKIKNSNKVSTVL
jgi:hypothetical protein